MKLSLEKKFHVPCPAPWELSFRCRKDYKPSSEWRGILVKVNVVFSTFFLNNSIFFWFFFFSFCCGFQMFHSHFGCEISVRVASCLSACYGCMGQFRRLMYTSSLSIFLPSRALCHMLSLRCKLELHPLWSEACLHMLSWKLMGFSKVVNTYLIGTCY